MAEVVESSFVFVHDTPRSTDVSVARNKRLVRAQAARRKPRSQKPSSNEQNGHKVPRSKKYQTRKSNRENESTVPDELHLNAEALGPGTSPSESQFSDYTSNSVGTVNSYQTSQWSEVDNESPSDIASSNLSGEIHTSSFSISEGSTLATNEDEIDEYAIMSPRMPGAGWSFPFVPPKCYSHPYTPMLIHHYLTNMAVNIPELDAGDPGILRSRWFPMVMTADALFNIVLLTAASHYAVFKNKVGDPYIKEVLLYLKFQTYTSIQKLVRSSSADSRTDSLIGAVAKLASYEAMFGSSALYHLHIRSLKLMINEKGGLDSLGLGGLLQRMVLWIDINSAFLLNSTAYFLPTVPLACHVIRQANPGHFLAEYSQAD